MRVFFSLSQSGVNNVFLMSTGYCSLLARQHLKVTFFTEHVLNVSKGICRLFV